MHAEITESCISFFVNNVFFPNVKLQMFLQNQLFWFSVKWTKKEEGAMTHNE